MIDNMGATCIAVEMKLYLLCKLVTGFDISRLRSKAFVNMYNGTITEPAAMLLLFCELTRKKVATI